MDSKGYFLIAAIGIQREFLRDSGFFINNLFIDFSDDIYKMMQIMS